MIKTKSLIVGLMLILMLLPIIAVAQVEFTSHVPAWGSYDGSPVWTQGTYAPMDAKIACKSDNSVCVALLYEWGDGVLIPRSLRLFHSTGNSNNQHFHNMAFSCSGLFGWWDTIFTGCTEIPVPSAFQVDYTTYRANDFGDEYPFPYGIMYNENDGKFYIVFSDIPSSTQNDVETYQYEYAGDLSSPTSVATYAKTGYMFMVNETTWVRSTCCTYYFDGANHRYQLDFTYCDLGSSTCHAYFDRTEMFNGGGQQYLCVQLSRHAGYGFEGDGGIQFDFDGDYRKGISDCVTASDVANARDAWTYTGSMSGFDYYDDTYFYFSIDSNSSSRVQSDGASFGGAELLYDWGASENFNMTVSDMTDENRVYLLQRGHATQGGVRSYNRRLYPFKVQLTGLDVMSGSVENVEVTTTMVCFEQNYSDTASGYSEVVTTPCAENNTVKLDVSGWMPETKIISNVDTLSSTGYTYIRSPSNGLGYVSDYNFTLKFVDSFSGNPVSGASVTVGAVTKTADSNGEVVFELSPYDSGELTPFEVGTSYFLYFNGTPATYDYEFSADGYADDYGTFSLTVVSIPDDVDDFDVHDTYLVDPTMLRFIVDVYTLDGMHYDGDSVVVRVGGAQQGTFYNDGGIYIERNYATAFPSTFFLLDNRTSWTANVNLTQDGYFVSDTIAVTNVTGVYRYDFTLPNASTEQECSTGAGCSESFCKGTNWYHNGECVGGNCEYEVQSCLLCDDDSGCYDDVTTETCPTGLDYECIGDNVCMDTKVLRSYKCSSDKLCIWELVECEYVCDDDVCTVPPTVVDCDQSTVTGMLTCMQGGVMSFIGSTYDPLMTIGIALSLVVIITALLGLGFKGLSSVLR